MRIDWSYSIPLSGEREMIAYVCAEIFSVVGIKKIDHPLGRMGMGSHMAADPQ